MIRFFLDDYFDIEGTNLMSTFDNKALKKVTFKPTKVLLWV